MKLEKPWQPWIDYQDKAPIHLDIFEPPCRHCKFFAPRIKTTRRGDFDGVVLCTSDEMEHDFSCFRERE